MSIQKGSPRFLEVLRNQKEAHKYHLRVQPIPCITRHRIYRFLFELSLRPSLIRSESQDFLKLRDDEQSG